MWPANRNAGATALARYWTALVRRAPADELSRLAQPLEPELVATIERMRSARNEPAPDPAFVARLEDDLMRSLAPNPSTLPLAPSHPLPSNGRTAVPNAGPWLPALTSDLRLRRLRFGAAFAAAAVVLLVLGLTLGPLGLGWRGDDKPTAIPAGAMQAPVIPSVEFLWSSRGNPEDKMVNAANLAIAPDGAIWVPDGRNARFQIFSPEGEFLEMWGSEGTGDGQFDFYPESLFYGYGRGAIAFAPDGSFYVADTGNHRIQKFGPDRAFITAWGSEGKGDGQFIGASDLAVDDQGRVYVVDTFRDQDSSGVNLIQVFDSDGRFLVSWGTPGTEPGQFSSPFGITVDRDGTILIADSFNNNVQRFSPEGDYVGGWGEPGALEGQIAGAVDVAVDAQGHIFEVDWTNNRVQVFDREGRFLVAWGEPGTVDGRFSGPVAVAVDDEGNVYVADDSGRVQKFRVNL